MSWGNQTNPVLAADYRRVADFANEYIKIGKNAFI